MSAADDVRSAQIRLDNTLKGISALQKSLENLIRYVNHPQVTIRSARRKMLEAVGILGFSQEGTNLALRSYAVDERLDQFMAQLRNLRDDLDDVANEVNDVKERASRWEGNLRH